MYKSKRSTMLIALIVVVTLILGALAISLSQSPVVAKAEALVEDNYNFTLTTAEEGGSAYKIAVKPAVRSSIKVAVIPGTFNGLPVTAIADNGFMSCTQLKRVVLPMSAKKVGNNAFANCAKLENITMPNVKSIGMNAFGSCASLNRLFIPRTVETVGANILRSNANTVYIQKSLNEVNLQWSSTWNNYYTGNIVYSADPTDVMHYREILDEANTNVIGYELSEDQNLPASEADVVIYNSFRPDENSEYLPVLNICSEAFMMSYANSITIKDRHAEDPSAPQFNHKINIRSNAFMYSYINDIVFEVEATFDYPADLEVGRIESMFDGSPIIGDSEGKSTRVFEGATIQSITLPANTTIINNQMFKYCDALKNIKIAGEVYNGENLLPNISRIGDSAFDSCSGLQNLHVPESVTAMGSGVFNDWGYVYNQNLHIDFYEDDLPLQWNADWSSGIRAKTTVTYKSLTDIVIDLQDGAGGKVTVGVRLGGNMPAITKPTRGGYVFKGIYSQPNGKGFQYYTADLESARTWDGAMMLYANWEQGGYTVTLDNGTNTVAINAIYGQPMPAVDKPKRDGYEFGGFYSVEEDGSHLYYYNSDMGSNRLWDKTESTTLFAEWTIKEYTITYANLLVGINPTTNPAKYTINDETITFSNPTNRRGYSGVWDIAKIEKGSFGDKTITAVWTPIRYNIFYENLRGGINPTFNPQTYTIEDATITFANPYGRDGYTGVWDIMRITTGSTNNVTVRAVWTAIEYDIIYSNLIGGINPDSNRNKYTIEDAAITFINPTRNGYKGEWDTVIIPAGSTGDRVITARWTAIKYDIYYENLLNGTNPTSNPAKYTIEDETITFIAPERAGYNGEWLPISIPSGSTGDITVVAVWTPIKYYITYDMRNGGENPIQNPLTYTIESPTINLNDPLKLGFKGWWTDASGKTVAQIPQGSTVDISLTANYVTLDFKIIYELGEGGVNNPENPPFINITDVIKLQNPTRPGYWFKEWKLNGEIVTTLSNISQDITLVAQWQLVEYFVKTSDETLEVNEEIAIIRFPDNNFNTSLYISVGANVRHLSIYGKRDTLRYIAYIVMAERTSDLELHLHDLTLAAPQGQAAIKMTSANTTLNLYTHGVCKIYGAQGSDGEKGRDANAAKSGTDARAIISGAGPGGSGKNGFVAISCYALVIHTSNLSVYGGDGGKGGIGGTGGETFSRGGTGGTGGIGGYAISVIGHLQIKGDNITIKGGTGGDGGTGGIGNGNNNGGSGGDGGKGGAAISGGYFIDNTCQNVLISIGIDGERGSKGPSSIITDPFCLEV